MGLFLDILHLPERVTNDALEGIYKAYSDGHAHGDIWAPHESVLIARLVELFTQRGLDRLEHVRAELTAWHTGVLHKPTVTPVPAPGMVQQWTEAELALTRLYLESLPPAQWTLDDHMLAIDYVCQKHMPPGALQAEAEWLAVRAGLMGKVQANLAKTSAKQADAVLAALPSTVEGAASQFSLSKSIASMLRFARARCVDNVRALSAGVARRMRSLVVDHLEQQAYGAPPPAGDSSLQTKLVDAFADLNRDWRRIAITEAGNAQLEGLVASLKPGSRVKRVEQYRGACAFCRKIDGVVATIVDPAKPDKNGDTEIWPGKNNVGRSASPRRRQGDMLVAREPHEMWWLPAGLAHPHCRGRWIPLAEPAPGDDPDFAAWLDKTLGGKPGKS